MENSIDSDPSAVFQYPLPLGFDINKQLDPQAQSSFQDMKELVLHYFYTDEPIKATETFQQMQKKILDGLMTSKNGKILEGDEDEVEKFFESEEVLNIIDDKEMFDEFLSSINNKDQWTLAIDEEDSKCYYRSHESEPYIEVMTECKINAPFSHVLAIMQEADLYAGWMPNITLCETIHFVANYRQLVKTVIQFPWPFTPRECIVKATGHFSEELGGLLDIVKSYKGKKYFSYEVADEKDDLVRMELKRGYHFIKYVDPQSCISIGTFLVDAKLQLVPDWLINYLMKSQCFDQINIIREKCKEFTNEENVYVKRIRQKRVCYGRAEEFCAAMEKKKLASLNQ